MLALPHSHSRSRSPFLWPSLLSAACLAAACGGGGGDEAASPAPASGMPASGCSPTRAGYDAVQLGMDEAAMAAAMGCSGAVLNQTTVEGLSQTTFHWGAAGTGPYAQVQARGGRVTAKTGQRLDATSAPSLCLPTEASFAALPSAADVATAAATLGCTGERVSESTVDGLTEHAYAWGSVVSGPYALLTFKNGALAARLAQRLTPSAAPSSCAPTRAGYDAVVSGLDRAAVEQRMGCAGQVLNEVAVAGLARQTLAWGDVVTGPYAQVNLDGGAVTGKMSLRLDAAAAGNCLPTQARFDALAIGATLAAARAAMGCDGEQVNEATVGGVRQVTHAWGQITAGPYVMVTLRADQLASKLAQRLDGTGAPSTCLPSATSHAALALGMTVAQAAATVGCDGQLLNEVVLAGSNQKTYAWGDVVTGPYQQVTFRNGVLSGKTGTRL